jgi:hypothetical protein
LQKLDREGRSRLDSDEVEELHLDYNEVDDIMLADITFDELTALSIIIEAVVKERFDKGDTGFNLTVALAKKRFSTELF